MGRALGTENLTAEKTDRDFFFFYHCFTKCRALPWPKGPRSFHASVCRPECIVVALIDVVSWSQDGVVVINITSVVWAGKRKMGQWDEGERVNGEGLFLFDGAWSFIVVLFSLTEHSRQVRRQERWRAEFWTADLRLISG